MLRYGPFYPDHGLERIVSFHERQDQRFAETGGRGASAATGKPILTATELAVTDPPTPGRPRFGTRPPSATPRPSGRSPPSTTSGGTSATGPAETDPGSPSGRRRHRPPGHAPVAGAEELPLAGGTGQHRPRAWRRRTGETAPPRSGPRWSWRPRRPFLWTLFTSLKPMSEIYQIPPTLLPQAEWR